MEDESAEIELLEQNLQKTHQISKRMISVLESFDTRLAKLEKSILPLYTSAQVLNKRTNNIDQTLAKIDEVASNQENLVVEEALILRGPQPGQLDEYKNALERLNALIAFKASNQTDTETAHLVETGSKKLTQLYTKLVAEGSSGAPPTPVGGSTNSYLYDDVPTLLPFPAALLANLRPLVSFLRTLPLPATHPSHPAAAGIYEALGEAQKGYADMRGSWSKKCLEGQAKRVVDRCVNAGSGGSGDSGYENVDEIGAGKEFGKWVDLMLSVAEDEYNLLTDLAPLPNHKLVATAYSSLLVPIVGLFTSTLSSLVAHIKKAIHKRAFLALSTYDALLKLQPRWESLLHLRDNVGDSGSVSSGGGGSNEIKEGLHSLRAVCLRSFPEFVAHIKLSGSAKSVVNAAEYTGEVTEFTQASVEYLEKLPLVRDAVCSALLSLGDGNWKMGEGVQVGKGAKLGEGDEQLILEHYVHDVINTTISALNTLAKGSRRAPVAGTFLLNNIYYLNAHILQAPKNVMLPGCVARPTQELLAHNQRTAKAGYFDSNFGLLMQALADDPKEVSAKRKRGSLYTV
ncbi:hypothetical protein AMATHDRAFT_69109 [Amanita thiersii Skay4041]|uniref:Exocyst complex subunit Exo70 C-terminal domain-containing protein n=1 Tax=Amanita thiersii Skay4041 TaxID=703135 RepID=A0A2A9N802_9AGAR|nr:hypothetical protein AMATHDRAFT_69109 [Amanita thiersii Skay4041]